MTKFWDGFGERLRAARLRAGLTQAQLSVKSGVGVRTVPAYETGSKPSLEEAQKIAEGLGVDVVWLLSGANSVGGVGPLREDESAEGDRWSGFRDRLRMERVRRGMSQQALSSAAGISMRTLGGYETKAQPSITECIKISEVLEVDLGWLLFGVPPQGGVPPAIEQFIALNSKVTPEEAEQLRKVRWYHPHVELTLGMAEDAWREIRDAQSRGQVTEKPQIRPGRKPLAR